MKRGHIGWAIRVGAVVALTAAAGLAPRSALRAAPTDVTFTRDIAPILQRSCQNCHHADGVAPMSLVTYEEVRPWARAIKQRTGIGPHAGVMPPWYIEKNVGIQKYKNDPSLSEAELAKVAQWADNGAPQGDPKDMPPARKFDDGNTWAIGTPDLVVATKEILVKGDSPDWWGEIESVPIGLTEDRYVAALEIKEFNDVEPAGSGRQTVGGRYVFHHMIWSTSVAAPGQSGPPPAGVSLAWPVHEVGRNADVFDPRSAKLLKANSWVVSDSIHLRQLLRHDGGRRIIDLAFAQHVGGESDHEDG